MTKHVIKKDQSETLKITENNSAWVIRQGVTLEGVPAIENYDMDNVTLDIAGHIATDGYGIFFKGYMPGTDTDGVSVNIAKTGRLVSNLYAITIEGDGTSVSNDGFIRSKSGACFDLKGEDLRFENRGDVVSDTGAVAYMMSDDFHIVNHGLLRTGGIYSAVSAMAIVEGTFVNGAGGAIKGGVSFIGSAGDIAAVNIGRIDAGQADNIAFAFGTGDDTLVNRGVINGIVNMGAGNDTAKLSRGKLIGSTISGGDDDDTFIIGKRDIHVVELDGGGDDTIRTSKSYTLGSLSGNFIETLEAQGSSNISLTGNMLDNVLIGNSGRNVLIGGNGDDLLRGGRGNDTLAGWAGADRFTFFAGDGVDTIEDFAKGTDKILLNLISDIDDFDDLEGRMSMSKDGLDTLIDLGNGDRIRLEDVNMSVLDQSCFTIIGEIVFP